MEYLSFNSIMPPLILLSLFFLISWILLKFTPFYKEKTALQEGERYESLDGLRGILALGVFFQHAVTNYTYFTTHEWHITDFSIFRHLGGEAVIIFFMITSFLYWSKAIAEKGKVDAFKLYKSRFYRLAPMYLFSSAIIITIALFATGFHINNFISFGRDIVSWLTLGLHTTLSVNDYNILPINAGIHWTLHFEWIFYLLLPIGAIALQNKKTGFLILPIIFAAFANAQWGYWIIFLFGMLSAHIVEKYPVVPIAKKFWSGLVPIFGLLAVYFVQKQEPYSTLQYCITLIVFLTFVYGNDLFGILKTSVARFLGTISYSIYLLHGIVIYAVLNITNIFYPIASMTQFNFWLTMFFAGCITIGVSALTYKYVEYPFIQKKKSKTTPIEVVEQVI